MPVNAEHVEARMEAFEEACREEGLRRTPQRLAVFREVAASDRHPSAEAVYKNVRRQLHSISRDTVYRTLRLLERRGLISTVGALHERARFDPNTDEHHHFICTRCGRVRDFYSSQFDAVEPPEEVRRWGRIESVQAEVRGVCTECLGRTDNA